eukprot:TRINITY_DN4714_c0_g1_i2.p1 TRINITY_DN4714_c0_g1~~TRINITY_DN4714_c0_g1_i2.p1  ORF type:complete len:576 (-),score=102.50 TRINITY_DN4714_c0_g1_i2:75-1802(-)
MTKVWQEEKYTPMAGNTRTFFYPPIDEYVCKIKLNATPNCEEENNSVGSLNAGEFFDAEEIVSELDGCVYLKFVNDEGVAGYCRKSVQFSLTFINDPYNLKKIKAVKEREGNWEAQRVDIYALKEEAPRMVANFTRENPDLISLIYKWERNTALGIGHNCIYQENGAVDTIIAAFNTFPEHTERLLNILVNMTERNSVLCTDFATKPIPQLLQILSREYDAQDTKIIGLAVHALYNINVYQTGIGLDMFPNPRDYYEALWALIQNYEVVGNLKLFRQSIFLVRILLSENIQFFPENMELVLVIGEKYIDEDLFYEILVLLIKYIEESSNYTQRVLDYISKYINECDSISSKIRFFKVLTMFSDDDVGLDLLNQANLLDLFTTIMFSENEYLYYYSICCIANLCQVNSAYNEQVAMYSQRITEMFANESLEEEMSKYIQDTTIRLLCINTSLKVNQELLDKIVVYFLNETDSVYLNNCLLVFYTYMTIPANNSLKSDEFQQKLDNIRPFFFGEIVDYIDQIAASINGVETNPVSETEKTINLLTQQLRDMGIDIGDVGELDLGVLQSLVQSMQENQ